MKEESRRRNRGGGTMKDDSWRKDNDNEGRISDEASGSIKGYLPASFWRDPADLDENSKSELLSRRNATFQNKIASCRDETLFVVFAPSKMRLPSKLNSSFQKEGMA